MTNQMPNIDPLEQERIGEMLDEYAANCYSLCYHDGNDRIIWVSFHLKTLLWAHECHPQYWSEMPTGYMCDMCGGRNLYTNNDTDSQSSDEYSSDDDQHIVYKEYHGPSKMRNVNKPRRYRIINRRFHTQRRRELYSIIKNEKN
jgi:hypothetical protein